METVFAFCEVEGEKQCVVESWQGYCREKRASKLLEGDEYGESAQLGASFRLNLCLPRSGVNESFGLQNDFIGSWIIKCPLHPFASNRVVWKQLSLFQLHWGHREETPALVLFVFHGVIEDGKPFLSTPEKTLYLHGYKSVTLTCSSGNCFTSKIQPTDDGASQDILMVSGLTE